MIRHNAQTDTNNSNDSFCVNEQNSSLKKKSQMSFIAFEKVRK